MVRHKHFAAATILPLAGALALPASAHENRLIPASPDQVQMTVGFHLEPTFYGTMNGVDVILYTYVESCIAAGGTDPTDFVGAPIDNQNGDTVNLQVEALLLDKEKPYYPGKPGNPTILKRTNITNVSPLDEGATYGSDSPPGYYDSWFNPSVPAGGPASGSLTAGYSAPGAYGFHIWGTVSTVANSYQCAGTNKPNPIPPITATIDEYYVCGQGTRTPGDGFFCVQSPQTAP